MKWVALAIAGAGYWTLLEYVLHRFAFHRPNRFMGKRHIAHHGDLKKRSLAVAPWQTMAGGGAIHAALFVGLFGWAGAVIFGGMMVGYAWYEWVHYGTHYFVARTRLGRYQRAYHLAHHHKSPKARFGVTSPFWDVVFGTYQPVPTGVRNEPGA